MNTQNKQPEALRLADRLDLYAAGDDHQRDTEQAAAELRRLHEQNRKLKTVMVAAAEEIAAHWDAHCDAEGYGPVNLMHRLEKGIASEYGYTAGAFSRLHEVNQELVKALQTILNTSLMDKGHWAKTIEAEAHAAITKATGEQGG